MPDRSQDTALVAGDQAFIAEATRMFSSAELASDSCVGSGFDLFAKKPVSNAMMRLNQVWLLDKDNPYVRVGDGVIFNEREKYW